MICGFLLAIGALRAVFLSQADLVLENQALRQQRAAFARNGQRPRIEIFFGWCSGFFGIWREAV